MDWGSIIGIVATVVFGIWSVLLFYKRQKYPGQLSFFVEPSIRLFDDITKDIPLLTVSYKGDPVPKNLTITRGYLLNTGSKDITNEMVYQPLQIHLSEGYRWLEASGKTTVDDVEHAKIIDPKTVEVSLGLFRRDEVIRFQGLIEVGEGKYWLEKFEFHHRIADTSHVTYHAIQMLKRPAKAWKMVLAILLPISIGIGMALQGLGHQPPLVLNIVLGLLFTLFFVIVFMVAFAMNRYIKRIRRLLKLDVKNSKC